MFNMGGFQGQAGRGFSVPKGVRARIRLGMNTVNRNTGFLSNSISLGGRNVSLGRAGATAGMGFLALRNGANMMDRMRYGDYGGAMMSGAMTAAAGYGAYKSWMLKGSMRKSLTDGASRLLRNLR